MKNLLIAFEMGMSCTAPWNTELREVAVSIAHLFDSYIEVIGVSRPLPTSLLAGEMDAYSAEALRPCTEADAYTAFENVFGGPRSAPAFTWNGLVATDAIGPHARVFDLIILARPGRVLDEPSRDLVENALFDSGRPVLLVPERTGRPDGTIVISWTDTVETARAITSAMPLLRSAQSVHLVSVQKEHEPPPQAERAMQALLRAGIKARCSIISERVSVGRTILEFAKEINADLLIKGAYTQTRLRRLIFGGTTDYILSHCQIPALLAN